MDDSEATPATALQQVIVSGIRLQAGLLLYGIEQLQHLSDAAAKGRGPQGIAEESSAALDGVADFLESGLDKTKRDALKSVSRVAARAVAKSADAIAKAVNQAK